VVPFLGLWDGRMDWDVKREREKDGKGFVVVVVVVVVADKTMYGMTMWRVLDDMTMRWKRIGRKWKFACFGAGQGSS
jgi:hypothetical protein